MLDHLLHELLSLIGQGVLFYFAIGAVLSSLLWLLSVVSGPVDRLDRWLKRNAPPRTYTRADHVRGWAIVCAVFGLGGLALQLTVGLH